MPISNVEPFEEGNNAAFERYKEKIKTAKIDNLPSFPSTVPSSVREGIVNGFEVSSEKEKIALKELLHEIKLCAFIKRYDFNDQNNTGVWPADMDPPGRFIEVRLSMNVGADGRWRPLFPVDQN